MRERLREALRAGRPLDLRPSGQGPVRVRNGRHWGPLRRVDAAMVAELLGDPDLSQERGSVPLRLIGARVTGSLDLGHARVGRALFAECCYFDEPIELSGAQLAWLSLRDCVMPAIIGYGLRVEVRGQIWLSGAQLGPAGGGYALNAPQAVIGGGMYCNGGFAAQGGVNLYGASIGVTVEFAGAKLSNPGGQALRAPGLTVGADLVLKPDFVSVGSIDLFGAEVKGQIWLNGARLNAGGARWALSAPLLKVGGGMYCRDAFACDGGVNLFGAAIGSTLEFEGASLTNPGGFALRAPGLSVASDVALSRGFAAKGGIDLSGAAIRGALDLDQARLSGVALTLTQAQIGTLRGEPSDPPAVWVLNGLTYASLEPYRLAAQALAWLRTSTRPYHPQPYEQLAGYYRSLGHDEQARTVQLAKQRHRRRGLRPVARLWGYLEDAALGYGYRPGRALLWLIGLGAALSAYFAVYPPRSTGAQAPHFQPVVYALDLLVPVLGLGEKSAYVPVGAGQWMAWAGMLAGWILATTILAAVTRTISRN